MSFSGHSGRATGERGEDLPAANPDTPPDSSDLTGRCPRCGRSSNFEKLGELPVTFGGSSVQTRRGPFVPDTLDQVSAFRCSGCGQATAVVEEKWVGDHPARDGMGSGGYLSFRGIHWWPPPGTEDLDPSIPESIRRAYAEGLKALSVRAPRAAAAMFRRTLEAIVKDKGGRDAQTSVEIRIVGNAGAHFDPMNDVKQAEAENLAKLLRSLLDYLYEMPARIQRTRASGAP